MDINNTQNKKQYISTLETIYLCFDEREQAAKDLSKIALALEGKRIVIEILRDMKRQTRKKNS